MAISKKRILGLRIESNLRIAGLSTEILFSFVHGLRENKCSVGNSAILSLNLILRPRIRFLHIAINDLKTIFQNINLRSGKNYFDDI